MSKRKGLSKRTRFEVFKRDSFICQYCGRSPPVVILEIDHVIAVSDGGGDDQFNLVTACFDCNRGKADVPLERRTASNAEVLTRERELSEQVDALNAFLMERRTEIEDSIRRLGVHWFNQHCREKDKYVFGTDRKASIRHFLKSLTEAEILEAVDLAHARVEAFDGDDQKAWKYFCGICWRKIKGDRKP